MKKVCVIGHFGKGKNLLNGQTVKAKILTSELIKKYGQHEVKIIDTHGGIKAFFKLPFFMFHAFLICKNIIILPAHKGLRIEVPIISCLNFLFHRSVHYVVIGGWLPEFLIKRRILALQLQKFNWIYVETSSMKYALEKIGFKNILVMPNFKRLKILRPEELIYQVAEPYPLCTLSRINRKKGIEDAVNAVIDINKKYGRKVYSLDIYGSIDSGEEEWFKSFSSDFPSYICYKGYIDFNKTIETVKRYFALLFPTKYYTEGIPGTLIDAFSAGVPVVASQWENFTDVIDNGCEGFGFEFNNYKSLLSILEYMASHNSEINKLKELCINKAIKFSPEKVMDILFTNLAANRVSRGGGII